jgi:hypothetical protein
MKFLYKWLIATLAGAASMFVWGGISHMVLLKGIGFTRRSNEERIVSTLRTSSPEDGLYFFPSIDLRGNPTAEEQATWEARFRTGPTGMIIYHAAGDAPVSPKKLSVQFLSDVLAAGIVSYLPSLAIATYWRRVGLAALLGVFGFIRHRLRLLELVRISERLLSCARCGHDRRLVTGRCRHRQADSACADLIAPPWPLPAGSGTYTLCVMPR